MLRDEPDPSERRLEISTDLLCGLDSGVWCADGNEADAAVDQRADDGRSLSFTSAPLPERIELLGNARVELELESDRPVAQLAARLCDVAPDGSVAARDARRAQPDPPRQPRAPGAARARAPARA